MYSRKNIFIFMATFMQYLVARFFLMWRVRISNNSYPYNLCHPYILLTIYYVSLLNLNLMGHGNYSHEILSYINYGH